MSFRNIRPSFGESSSASASASAPTTTTTPSHSISEPSVHDPRRIRGESASKDGDGNASGSQTSAKRRRVPESVTRNACLNCKKARAKCDGKQPCKRCASRVETSECVYEVHIKHAKEELVRQIKDLKAKDHLTEQILQALSSNDDTQVPEILERLRKGEAYQSIVEWLGSSSSVEETMSPKGSQHSTNFEPSDHEMTGLRSSDSPFQWTYVTSDPAVLDHLLQLYFAWVHPVHVLFSEGHFVNSYKKKSTDYCSENLVNAICAMACHLHSTAAGDVVDFEQLGAAFTEAVRSRIDPADSSVTTIQAFAVLFLVECAQSKALRAASYLKVATNNLANVQPLQTDSFSLVLKHTTCGIRNLNIEWAQVTFQVPDADCHPSSESVEDVDDQLDSAKWYFYRHATDQYPAAWPGLLATTNREKTRLLNIVHEINIMMYSRHAPQIAAIDVLKLYARLKTWREGLPREIADIEKNETPASPHVLSLLILYETSVVQLLRPLLDLEGFPSSLVAEVVWSHGQYALSLLDERYRARYTCRYQPVMQMFALLHLTDIVARFFSNAVEESDRTRINGPRAIELGMECLMHSRAGLPVAGPMQEMLRRTANECSIQLPRNLSELMAPPRPPKQVYRMDDLIDACTRPSYVQPVADIHKKYAPSFSTYWVTDGAAFGFHEPDVGALKLRLPSAEERGAQSLMQIRNLLNEN